MTLFAFLKKGKWGSICLFTFTLLIFNVLDLWRNKKSNEMSIIKNNNSNTKFDTKIYDSFCISKKRQVGVHLPFYFYIINI